MKVEIFNDNIETEELNIFFLKSLGYTIFHNPKFLSYHSKDKFLNYKEFTIFYLLFRDKSKIIAFLPGSSYIDENGLKTFKSPFFSSFGGFVLTHELDFELIENIIDASISLFKEHKFSKILIDLIPECYLGDHYYLTSYLFYIFLSKGFRISGCDLLLAKPIIDINNFESLDYSIRKQIKQAYRNNLVFEETKIDLEIYSLLVNNRKKFNAIPTHTFEELISINELIPNLLYVFKTTHDDKIIAGAITIKANEYALNTFYLFDHENYRNYRGMQFTYYKVIEWAIANSFKYVDFGPSTFGLSPNHSLIHYKEKYGGNPFLRNTFEIKL